MALAGLDSALIRAEAVAALVVGCHELLQLGHGEAVAAGLVDIVDELLGADPAVDVHVQTGVLRGVPQQAAEVDGQLGLAHDGSLP